MDLYRDILKSYQELENELNTQKILFKLNVCLEKIETLLMLEFPKEFYSLFIHIKNEIIHQKNILQHKIECKTSRVIQTRRKYASVSNNFLEEVSIRKTKRQNFSNNILNEIKTTIEIIPKIKGLQEIIGYGEIKRMLQTYIILPLHQPQLFSKQNAINSLLLYGPPGTGKTRLAHALASEAHSKLLCVSPSDILSEYIGGTEKSIKTLFSYIRESPSFTILFIDEIDGICRKRSGQEQESSRRLKTELMCQLNNFQEYEKAILICATNCPWDLDSAFIRRFQKKIYIPLPDRKERFELLMFYIKDTPLSTATIDWGEVLSQTDGYSASDVASLVQNALNIPLTELIENKKWKLRDDGIYEPAKDYETDLIFCCLKDIPENSVRARDINASDLLKAVKEVKRTISESEIERYKEYKNCY